MKQRAITAIGILLVTIPLVIFSQYIIYPIVIAALALRGTFEMLRLFGVQRSVIISLPAYLISLVFPISTYFVTDATISTLLLALAGTLFVYLLLLLGTSVFSRGEKTFSKISEIFLSITYVTVSFTALALTRYLDMQTGAYLIALVFIVTWICDGGAYVVGSLIGKHKLIPEISPKKTVEGAVGGIVIATLAFLLYGFILDMLIDGMVVDYLVLCVYGILMSLVSQLGDLAASLIKREYGIKDYGRLFPGHGGVMDRFDSVLSVSTIVMILCMVLPPFSF